MFARVALTAPILVGYARLRAIDLQIRSHWRQFLVLGFLGSALPFTLIAWAELTVSGSMTAILLSATPLFTALVAVPGLGERLTVYKLIGAAMGIIGVSIVVGGSPMTLDARFLLAALALLGAAFSYALGGVYAKRTFQSLNNLSMSSGQLIAAALILAPVSLFDLPRELPPTGAILALLALVLVCTAFAYQLYYYLIISAGPILAGADFWCDFGRHLAARAHQPGHVIRSADRSVQRWIGDRHGLAKAASPGKKSLTLLPDGWSLGHSYSARSLNRARAQASMNKGEGSANRASSQDKSRTQVSIRSATTRPTRAVISGP